MRYRNQERTKKNGQKKAALDNSTQTVGNNAGALFPPQEGLTRPEGINEAEQETK